MQIYSTEYRLFQMSARGWGQHSNSELRFRQIHKKPKQTDVYMILAFSLQKNRKHWKQENDKPVEETFLPCVT